MNDAQLRVAAEQLDHAPRDRPIQAPRALGPTGHEDRAKTVTERTPRDGAQLGADGVAGVDDTGVGKVGRSLRKGGGHHPGSPGEHPGGAARDRVLLKQDHRDALGQRRHDHGHRHVSPDADHDIGTQPAQQPPRGDGCPGHLGGGASDAPCAPDIDATDLEGLQVQPGCHHQPLRDPVAAADHGDLVVRPIVSERERDRQGRGQVTPSSPPSDQRAHDSSSLAVDPGRRC